MERLFRFCLDRTEWNGNITTFFFGCYCMCRAHTSSNEIAHLHEPNVHVLLACHFTLPPHEARWIRSIDIRIPYILHSMSHLLCAMLALGSAMCNTLDSRLITPIKCMQSIHYCRVQRGGVMKCITYNFHMVWRANIADFLRIWTFPPGIVNSFMYIFLWFFAYLITNTYM